VTKFANFRRRVRALRRVKTDQAARLCISHLGGADYVNLLSPTGEKTILVVHGSKLHDRTETGWRARLQLRWLLPRLYRRADHIVTVSQAIATELIGLGLPAERISTIYNFFEPDGIRARAAESLTAAEQAVFAGAPTIVTTGRLHPQKNQAGLIEAFARLRRTAAAKLVLIGDGPLRADLLDQARALGLKTWDVWSGMEPNADAECYFLGFQDNPFKYLSHATVFALPSSWEGLPMVLGEAMACGVPLLSTDCPTGPREFLAPGTAAPNGALTSEEKADAGWLLPLLDGSVPLDPALDCWAAALAALLADRPERERLARRSLARADDFSRARIAPQWFALVDRVLATQPPAIAPR
jgi:glycosyltransferase involved in cell wall biosynthesis